MTKDELIKDSYSRLIHMRAQIEHIEEDPDQYEQNVSDNGNHSDTFSAGFEYGHTSGQIAELERLIEILEADES